LTEFRPWPYDGGTQVPEDDFHKILEFAYRTGGKLDDTVLEDLEALTTAEQTLGAEHPETLTCRINLAHAYYEAGRVDEAIALGEQVFGECGRILGPDAHDTLIAGNNLASAYREAGRLDDSISICIQSLAAAEGSLGRDDPMSVTLINHLADAYSAAERIEEATELLLEVLSTRERTLGPDDLETLGARNNLALAYRDAGRLDEAVELLKRALADAERLMGSDHDGVLTMRANLASLYDDLGRTMEAVDAYERALQDRTRVLGAEHPDTLLSEATLGAMYKDTGRLDEAAELTEAALTGLQRLFGADHRDVLRVRIRLALVYTASGRVEEGIALLEDALAGCERLFDADHPDTVRCRRDLADAYREAGRADDAVPLFERVLSDWERILGPDDRETMGVRNLLALAYDDAGRKEEAIAAYDRTLTDRERVLGPDHPATLLSRSNVALTYRELGRLEEAVSTMRVVVAGRQQVLGPDHIDTLRSRNHLALVCEESGRLEEAIELYEETLKDCERVLGADHELARKVAFNLDDARPPAWEPQYEVEERLAEAKKRGDADAYLRLLAGVDLFVLAPKKRADDVVAGRHDMLQWLVRTVDGHEHAQVFTRGAIPNQPGAVYLMKSIATLAQDWPDPDWRVLFNRGVPALEWSFPHEALVRLAHDPDIMPLPANRLLTRTGGPVEGPLAFGLACGALLAVQGAVPWNDVGLVYEDYLDRMRSLRDMWGITNAEEWLGTMNALLGESGGDPRASLVLLLRHEEARRTEHRVEPDAWRRAIERWCREDGVPEETVGALLGLAGTIGRYEERFRADGLLPAGGFVHSTLAYDFGRAVNMVRWGREAQFCDQATAERLVIGAGEQCRRHYGSWEALSAGYVLGRVLRFDDEEFGTWYQSALAAHRVLTEATDGPWQALTW
jgi:tetratricopeptide (TPR) repeat protein